MTCLDDPTVYFDHYNFNFRQRRGRNLAHSGLRLSCLFVFPKRPNLDSVRHQTQLWTFQSVGIELQLQLVSPAVPEVATR